MDEEVVSEGRWDFPMKKYRKDLLRKGESPWEYRYPACKGNSWLHSPIRTQREKIRCRRVRNPSTGVVPLTFYKEGVRG